MLYFIDQTIYMETIKLGAISGTIGAIASIIPGTFTRRIFKIAQLNFLDYASVLIVGHKVNTMLSPREYF